MTKKIKWNFGDVFTVPLLNKSYSIGQILDLQMPNIVRIALYDEIINDYENTDTDILCQTKNLISLVWPWLR